VALTSLEGEDAARPIIEEQDRAIAQKSGNAPIPIKNIRRSVEK
jgi:hypothetical protein